MNLYDKMIEALQRRRMPTDDTKYSSGDPSIPEPLSVEDELQAIQAQHSVDEQDAASKQGGVAQNFFNQGQPAPEREPASGQNYVSQIPWARPGGNSDDGSASPQRKVLGIPLPDAEKALTSLRARPQNDALSMMLSAQSGANDNQLSSNLTRAGIQAGAAIGHVKPDYSTIDAIAKGDNQPVENVKGALGAEKTGMDLTKESMDLERSQKYEDPQNPENQAFRNALKSILPKNATSMPGFDQVTLNNPGPFEKIAQIYSQLEAKKAQQQATALQRDQMHSDRERRTAETNQRAALGRLAGNKELRDRLQQAQNLTNNMAQYSKADYLTPQNIFEIQNSVRTNLGIKGSSIGKEREASYYKSLGWNAKDLIQFVTGDPENISKDDKLVQHIKQLAEIESGQAKTQYRSTLNALGAGLESMHEKYGDLKSDWDHVMDTYDKKVDSGGAPSTSDAASGASGLTPEQRRTRIEQLKNELGKK